MPLQCETGVKVEPLQVAVPQETPVPPSWHLPAPSQAPVFPQGGLVAQRPCGSRLLDGTFAQLPALPVEVAGLAGRARGGAAADAVDAAVPRQAVGRHGARLSEAVLGAAEAGLRIADEGRRAVRIQRTGRLAGRAAVADEGGAGDRRRRLAGSLAVAGAARGQRRCRWTGRRGARRRCRPRSSGRPRRRRRSRRCHRWCSLDRGRSPADRPSRSGRCCRSRARL